MAATTWLTVAQVAVMVGKKPRTVRRWCRTGFLSGARQIGRGWQIPQSAVDALLNPETVAA
jgi:excisionase family DNA binding protein